MMMGIRKTVSEKAPGEFDFEQVLRGYGHYTKVLIEENSLSVEHTKKVWFHKDKTDSVVVNYNHLDRIELKGQFIKLTLIWGIIIGIIGICTLQLYALLGTAFLAFLAYSKNIVIVRKDGSKVIIQNGGLLTGGGRAEFERLIPALTTKIGRQVYSAPVKA